VRALTRRTGAVVLAMNALILIYSHHAAVRELESTMAQMLEPLEAFDAQGATPVPRPPTEKTWKFHQKSHPFGWLFSILLISMQCTSAATGR
jgi:hypothetical protein